MNWKPFWFEGNLWFGMVHGIKEWEEIRKAYDCDDDRILDAKEATYGGHLTADERRERPNFGFRLEHDGAKRVRDFFAENGMSLEVAKT